MDNNNYYCYSLRQYHFLSAFGERCYVSKINSVSRKRYWVFKKSERLDSLIKLYKKIIHNY